MNRPSYPIWLPPLVAAGISLLLAAIIVACGPAGALESFVLSFILFVPVPAAIVAGAIFAAWPLVRRIVPDEPLSLRIATSGALGLGLQGLLVLALGLAGWINHATAVAIVFIPGAIGAADAAIAHRRLRHANAPPSHVPTTHTPSRAAWLVLLACPFAAISLCGSALLPAFLWSPDPFPYDVASYHLQIPRQWFDAGKITPLNENIFSYFPHGAETLDLLSMEIAGDPWVGMYDTQYLSFFQTMLMLAAIWGGVLALAKSDAADPRRATLAAALATVAAASVPWITMLSCVAYVEGLMLLHTAGATVWALLAAMPGNGRCRRAVLAGVLAGLACGTKYTAVPMTLIPLAVAVAATIWRTRALRIDIPIKRMVLIPATLLIAGAVAFSPWPIRNLNWTGNPVFPLALHTLGSHNLTPAQIDRFITAHEPTSDQATLGARGNALVEQVLAWWQYGYVLVPLGFAAAFCRLRRPAGVFFSVVMVWILFVWLFFTHLEGRFFVPIIPTAALAAGAWFVQIPSRAPRATVIAIGATILSFALGLLVVVTQFVLQARPGQQDSYFAVFSNRSELLIALHPEFRDVADKVSQPDFKLALIGDAQAFLYPMPSANLLYRDVFDVNIPAGVSLTDGWLGQSVDTLRHEGYWVDIDPSELRRLTGTYRDLAPLSDDLSHQADRQLLPPLNSSQPPSHN